MLRFEKLSRFDRLQEPCSAAIPFARGLLGDASRFVVLDGDRPLPTQSMVTAAWPDGSVRWLHVEFLVDLPANEGKSLRWRCDGEPSPLPAPAAGVLRTDAGLSLDSGVAVLHLGLPGNPDPLPGLAAGPLRLGPGELRGPILIDESGSEWPAVVDADGWSILREGPVHTVVEATGKHRNPAGDGLLDFRLRCHAFAGKPWFQVDHRLIHREDVPRITVKGWVLRVRPARPPEDVRTALGISNYKTRVRHGHGDQRLWHCIDAEQLVYESNEQVPEVHYGTFWADWSAPGRGGLCVTVYQAQQNFPKALAV
ncbi:MAG: hypothetical protein JXR77_08770, partial [Lentisphaeria bacterium]|nr:hypothetical protein [Lentisphaeria bacterium]